jgi:hypothetical protein
MDELECMRVIDGSLQAVGDEAARARIASWIASKYGGLRPMATAGFGVVPEVASSAGAARPNEIPGIAKLSQNGELQLTVRDFKAKSANDAAVRLVHVVVLAAAKLTGETFVSSKGVVLPCLRKYRCYDGNTRRALAAEKGIVRDGDLLSLDFHAEQFAEKVFLEILDPAIEGKWKPGSSRRRNSRPGTVQIEAI